MIIDRKDAVDWWLMSSRSNSEIVAQSFGAADYNGCVSAQG